MTYTNEINWKAATDSVTVRLRQAFAGADFSIKANCDPEGVPASYTIGKLNYKAPDGIEAPSQEVLAEAKRIFEEIWPEALLPIEGVPPGHLEVA